MRPRHVYRNREFLKLDRHTIGNQLQTPENLRLKSANGSQLSIYGIFEIHIHVLGKAITHPFVIIDGLISDGILGIDFIARHELVIWGTGPTMKSKFKRNLNEGDLDSIQQSQTAENAEATIIAKSKTTIPANSAKLIDVALIDNKNNEIKSGLYVTANKLESPVEAIDLIIEVKNTNKMLIINKMNENYEISCTEKIATWLKM